MNALAWIGAITGLVGGITGLLGFGFQVWFHLASGPRIKLSTLWALNLQKGEESLNIEVVNKGRMSAKIQSISIQYSTSDHSPLSFFPIGDITGPGFPSSIESHSAANWLVTLSSLNAAIASNNATKKVRTRVTLETGKVLESKWITLPEQGK